MQKTSLVTGGAGFIGSHVARHLIDKGHRVIVLDDLSGGSIRNVPAEVHFCKGSIADVSLVNGLFETYQFDYVYHLAAYAAEGLSHFARKFNYENNLVGSVNLINAAVNFKVKRFIFTSSIAVYGNNELPFSENQQPNPEDPYGIAKYAVEMDLRNAHEMFGLEYTIFRPHNVYGPHQNIADKYRNVVGIFMNQLLRGKPLTIFGDGEQTRAFSYIDDVAPYIATATDHGGTANEIFNIGGEISFTVNELAHEVMEAMNIESDITYLDARQEVVHAHALQEKFKAVFNPVKSTSLKDGLVKMATWVLETPDQGVSQEIPIEIEKNLPESWKKTH